MAQAVNDFLQNDLLAQASTDNQSGPSAKADPDLKVRTALDRAAARITGKFEQQPEVEAAIRDTIGQTYMDLGLYPEARTAIRAGAGLAPPGAGAENPKTLRTVQPPWSHWPSVRVGTRRPRRCSARRWRSSAAC